MAKEEADTLHEREGTCENAVNTRKQTTQTREKKYSGQKQCQCNDCGKSFTRKSSLIVHQRIHTGEKLFMCSECGKRFGLKSSMVRHMRTHTPKVQKICPECGKSFSRYPSLFQHQKVHRRERLYRCSYCEKSFMRASQLLVHQRIHKRRPLSERADCEENIHNMDRLRTQKNVVCLECGKSFQEYQSLMRHKQLHKVKSTSTVSTDRTEGFACDMSFYANEHYNASQSSQTVNVVEQITVGPFCAEKKTLEVEKRFLCIDCGKCFTRKSSLIVHQRIHTGEKLFMCSECGKRFGLKSSMVRHLKTHSSTIHLQQQKVHRREKLHKCPQCEKSFSRASQLIAHERSHKVKVCYSRSKSAGPSLRNSETDLFKDSSLEESHICLECGKSFRRQSAFIRHQRIHKGNSYLYTPYNGKHSNSQSVNKDDLEAPKQEKSIVTENSSLCLDKKSYIVIKYGANTDSKTSKEAKSFLCIDCGKCFTRKSSLIVHQRTHTGEKLFMCTDCGKRFSLKSSLVRHMRTHSPKILNICSDCGKCFTRYSSLFQHQKVHRREKSYKCPHCEKNFSQASQLLFHQRTHKVEKAHLNSETGEDSDVQDKLNCYVRDNCADEPHVCLEDRKHFMEESLLSAHIGNSEYCSYTDQEHNANSEIPHLGLEINCKPSEINLKNLKSQNIICNALSKVIETEKVVNFDCAIDNSICKPRLSSSKKAYQCIQCGKSFTRKSSLIVHQRIHTGEKHFKCTDCGKRFGFKSSLVRHLRTHTGQMFNVCSKCGIYFSRYCDLLLHLENHMGQLQSTCNALSKLEANDQQCQLTMQQPLNANKDDVTVPLMKKQESGIQEKNQRPYGSGEVLPNASTVKTFFDPLCKEKLKEGSLNVKQEKSENISADGEPNKSQKKKDVCTHPCTLYSGNELNILESFIKGCTEKTDQTGNHSEQPILNVLNNHNLGESIQNGSDKRLWRTQSKEERFLCSECGKNFTRKSSLIVHQRIHTGEKLFMCTECGKRFGLKSSMVRHMRIHNVKYFKCMACGKNFRDYSKFLEHQTSHSGELPYTEPQLSVH
ncbi:zinc finger protein 585A-like [Hyla sarda]|uniref:zinc finger protein 585A-like n=1 Tax=Hyla sarda TaxID=327740 RepID=UPI0024C3988B|nr:zinc finger protein 585A-like [Hyla sarda]XP_056428939.1 zinc finger protein 585A-like [Hyla sarda]XP_056428940.1 zinc finger protein 585A-like [Hyla sarda]XP_056428941.1 zinc finger protein 585A-like [Hyla sarda]XP_056428942.1 zinc finger protein 585A-like [Hyla sarda]